MGGHTMSGPVRSSGRYDYLSIEDRPGIEWPDGKRLAVYVAIGVEDYEFGSGATEDILPGTPEPDLVNTSWRDYGNRVGGFRLLDLLRRFGIPPTILLNTGAYDAAPALLAAARRAGAEIVGHGVSNSHSLTNLDEPAERHYLRAVAERIQAEEGAPPRGWSSPWLTQTDHSIDLLGETGYRYLLDLRMDDRPVWLKTRGAPLLAIPYALELNDSTSMIGRQVPAHEFADMIIDEFEELRAAAREQPLAMSIVLHSFISGAPFRLRQLARALEHLAAHDGEVWFTQPGRIFDAVVDPGAKRLHAQPLR